MFTHQTETTSTRVLLESGWTILPHQGVAVLHVAPPEPAVNLISVNPQEIKGIGTFELVNPSDRRAIDPRLHQVLLDESLREYERIWRVLAEK
jgi:hypothetical protein